MGTAIPPNRAPFTVDEIARATGGRVLRGGEPSVGVCTDSRAITEGATFVALSGERFDGHAFLSDVLAKGARTLVVSREDVPPSGAVVQVPDTRVALGDLARAHRLRWGGSGARLVVAITGSAGKTTTKAVLARLLEAMAPGTVHATSGNLNNDVGLPMTLFGLEGRHRHAVVEVGTNARGEIERLCAIAKPDVGVLTLVAAAHTEGLGTIDDVATEKGSLFEALPAAGLAVANVDNAPAVAQLQRSRAKTSLTYGFSKHADYRIASAELRSALATRLRIERRAGVVEMESPLLGEAGALAVAAALAVAEWALARPAEADELGSALSAVDVLSAGRLHPVLLADGTVVIDDSYNANPASMEASVRAAFAIAALEKRRLVLALGEMRELGAISPSEHDQIGLLVARGEVAAVIGIGGDAERITSAAARSGKDACFAADADRAAEVVLAKVRPGDLVLVKGSRSVHTETIVRALAQARGRAPSRGGRA